MLAAWLLAFWGNDSYLWIIIAILLIDAGMQCIHLSAQGLFMLMTNGVGATIGTIAAQAVINHYTFAMPLDGDVLTVALMLAVIAILPIILGAVANMNISMGGTSIIIVVGVALDTARSLESQMMMRHYKGFLE